MRSGHKDK
jgi:hypothetical protein